jgi:long-chain acyl-CoA synthetase
MRAGKPKFDENPDPYYLAEIDPEALALLVFTSGTTGKGKGVMLSQNAVLEDMTNIIPYIDFGNKTVGVLPPHHTYGSSVMLVGHAIIGCEIFISGGLRYITKELAEQKPEHLVLVPLYLETFYRKIWANIKSQGKEKLIKNMIKLSNGMCKIGIDLRKKIFAQVRAAFGGEVKMIISGGAPINPEILDFFRAMGITTLNGYGITECAPIVACNVSRNIVPGSIGNAIDCDEIKILDPNEDGEGELCVKGPNVMLGYYGDPEATAEAFTEDGFFRTGDYGKMSEDGTLYITGRKKNLIILSNGKNVYPEEIEKELIAVPGILDIVVYEGQSKRGLAHNAIVAEIFPDEDYVKANGIEDIKAHIKPYIDEYNKTAVSYKKIGVLKIRTTPFPKNTLRKITRFKIDMTID